MNTWRGCSTLVGLVLVSLAAACASTGECCDPARVAWSAPGFSGMAQMCPATYVVVHDVKAHKPGPRLGLLHVRKGLPVHYEPLAVEDWMSPHGRASDLESICALPDRPGEFLAAESGSWEGRKGRLFHVQVAGRATRVLAVHELPFLKDNGPDVDGDNFEGLACARLGGEGERLLVILGERGGTSAYPDGVLRWGVLDLDKGDMTWDGSAGVRVAAPGPWFAPLKKRDISALHLDPDLSLWAVGTEDEGDEGPFKSVIYLVARIRLDSVRPIEPLAQPTPGWIVEGLKVEALAGPSATTPKSPLSYASEDEHLGGVWRPLYQEPRRP